MVTARQVSGSPSISIVIPTFNRRERLARVLGALEKQSADPAAFEVVIVDDGSSDGTAGWLESQRPKYALRVIRQANSGPARARNAGVEAARGELLLFLDDDVEPSTDLVLEHLRSHEGDANLVVIGPLASLSHYRQPWVAWEQNKLEGQYAAMLRGDWEPTFRQFWTGNASVRRAHVVEAGGFNPDFLRAEDVELGIRLHQRGLRFRFNPAARALHYAERSLESWEHAHRSYGNLEVSIFALADDDAVIQILADNWRRLHPATRWLVQQCLKHPRRRASATFALRSWLNASAKLNRPIFSNSACSVLANLLYWQASVQALGPDRAGRVFQRAEQRKDPGG